ncbi:Plakophilin-4 [Taenia crassiceps]|uniref:Plakophilin-4 n=1 Tax=Taenia crassiceps TaxID=6207 RepID=A0ABR4QSZ4_9CEST
MRDDACLAKDQQHLKKSRVPHYSLMNSKTTVRQRFIPSFWNFQSNTDLSTSTDIPCLVNRLNSSNPTVQATAAACIQHLVYKNDDAKEEAWRAGGLGSLIGLLTSKEPSVVSSATGALRNLTSGSNIPICLEFERSNGINTLVWLLRQHLQSLTEEKSGDNEVSKLNADRILKSLDNVSAILCNLTSIESMRRRVVVEATIPVLVTTVLIPVAEAIRNSLHNFSNGNPPLHSTFLYRNCTAVIRNMSCCEDANTRAQLRGCEGLLESLLQVMRMAAATGLADTKAVENCACAVRNLCFALGEATKPQGSHLLKRTLISRSHSSIAEGRKQKGFDVHNKVEEASVPALNVPEAVLWHPNAVATFLALLHRASNPACIEATAGAIQNLTSSAKWQPAEIVRSEVRLQKGLPILVDLLHFPDNAVVATVAMTLQNLMLEKETLKHLGNSSLPALVACLSLHPAMSRSRSLSSLTTNTTSGIHLHTQLNCQVLLPILTLCSKIILSHDNFTSHFVELGGVQYCKTIVQALSAEQESALPNVHRSCYQAVHQLLRSLWKLKRLRFLYKENGLTEVDFLQKKRNKFPQSSIHQSRLRRVPLTIAQYCGEGEERQRKYHQTCSHRPIYDPEESFQRVPSATSGPLYQLDVLANNMRWGSEDTLQLFEPPFGVRVPFLFPNAAGVGATTWDGQHAAFATLPWDQWSDSKAHRREHSEGSLSCGRGAVIYENCS